VFSLSRRTLLPCVAFTAEKLFQRLISLVPRVLWLACEVNMPGALMGDSPDMRRTLPVDNFQAPESASSLRRTPECKPGLRRTVGKTDKGLPALP
jgi:hypothetical protein